MERVEKAIELNEFGEFDLSMDEFVDTTTKVSVKFLLDVSESMSWYGGIESIWAGINVFLDALKSDEYASTCVEVSISIFNHEVKEIVPFTPINEIKKLSKFKASGTTNLALAVNESLDDIEKRNEYYKQNSIKYKAPWFVLLTDCDIIGSDIDSVVQRTISLIEKRKLTMFTIGTGTKVNIKQLKRFNPTKPVILSPEEEDLVPLFEWLSATATGYSQVGSGEQFKSEELDRRYELVG